MIPIPGEDLKNYLTKDGVISSSDFDVLQKEAGRIGEDVSDLLISKDIIKKDYYYNLLVRYFGVELANLSERGIDPEALNLITEEIARERKSIPFKKEGKGLSVAMENPGDLESLDFLSRKLNLTIKPYLATTEDADNGYALYGGANVRDFKRQIEDNIIASLHNRARGIEEQATQIPIVAIVNNIVEYAIALRASDIHFELTEEEIVLRYRVDGALKEIIRMPKEVASPIVARLKLLGGLKIDEHQKPQDGRFRQTVGTDYIDVRLSVMPTFFGEKAEMRLLTSSQKPLSLEELGMAPEMIKMVQDNITKSYGMLLVTGPTGSGKTTTLYSILNMLNHPNVNIVTIEDPIEYNMKYVNQTQVNPQAGITFSSGLRAFLRQDPNIILVGEIRDQETADIAVNAALTGHLLLSSLHTNDAPTAVPRLLDMKVEPFLVSAVLNAVVAQRLVKKICTSCIYSYKPNETIAALIKDELKKIGDADKIAIPKLLFKGKGCPACSTSGFHGRLGIYEILTVTDEIRVVIVEPNFTLQNLIATARKNGMRTMFEDGLAKAETGLTTIEEVLTVIKQ